MKQAKSINTKCDKNISKSHHKREAVEGYYPFLEPQSRWRRESLFQKQPVAFCLHKSCKSNLHGTQKKQVQARGWTPESVQWGIDLKRFQTCFQTGSFVLRKLSTNYAINYKEEFHPTIRIPHKSLENILPFLDFILNTGYKETEFLSKRFAPLCLNCQH